MDLSPRLLAFLQHEMQTVMDDSDRRGEFRHSASEVLNQVENEIQHLKEQTENGASTQ